MNKKLLKDENELYIEEFKEGIEMRKVRKIGKGRKKVKVEILLSPDGGYEVYVEGNRVMNEYIENEIVWLVKESNEGKPYFD